MNKIDSDTKIYALIGDPVSKSLSPAIHNFMYDDLGLNNVYLTFNIKEKDLKAGLESLKLLGIKGFNVTLPHKENIIKYLDEIDSDAEKLGAVNTVKVKDDGRMLGYNTDGIGFVESLYDEGVNLKDENILVLGAGGAAKSIAYKLAEEDINSLYIANRTEEKAVKLIENINKNLDKKVCKSFNGNLEDIDLLVNTTSLGMYPDNSMYPIDLDKAKESLVVADAIYKPLKTKLLLEAEKRGFKIINGIGMLVNQGVKSQEIWLDKKLNKSLNKKVKAYLSDNILS